MSVPILPAKLSPPPLPAAYVARERLDRLWGEWRDERLILVTAGAGFGKTSLLSARAQALGPACLWYSIDDLHFVAGAPEVLHFLERLIRCLPEETTLALASWEPIEFGTAKLRAQGRVALLSANDLRLSAEEISALYHRRFPGARHPEQVFRRIAARTEGWAAGVEIFLQTLEGDSVPAIDAALARVAAAGTGWFAYFAEEVLRRLDPETQDFLCRSALLPRLDPELCDQLLERQDSRVVLDRLSERNLFTFARGKDLEGYRYHRLFQEFLLAQLQRRLSPAAIRRLHRRAARALIRSGAWADALAASVEGGDPAGALRLVERAGEDLLVSGQYQAVGSALRRIPARDLSRHAGALFVLGRLCDIQARWQEADTHYRQALRLSTSSRQRAEILRLLGRLHCRWGGCWRDSTAAGDATCLLADLTLAAGERREALDQASEGLRLAEALEYPSIEAHSRQTLGRIALLEGDLASAQEHFEKVLRIGETLAEQEFAVLPRLGLAEILLARGNRHAAIRITRVALASATSARTPWPLGRCHLLLGRLERAPGPAGGHWRRAEALRHDIEVEYAGSLLVRIGQRAIPHLEALLGNAAEETRGRAIELLSLLGGEPARAALERAAGRSGETGRAAREAVAEFAGESAPPLKIRALGPFEVQAGAQVLTHGGWRSARALRLFLLLLVHRFRWVPRDVILETLWPEAEPEKALNSLRQTVHLLRRTLEPDLPRSLQSRYVRFRNEACRLEPGEGHAYDVEDLESALQQGERFWHAGRQSRARVSLLEAVELYRGDFLSESPYEEFAAAEREHVRDRVLRAIERLLELRAAAREWGELALLSRRALALDAYRECHYRHLVLAHLHLGHRREALAGYHEYEAMMINEMGLPPSERMRSLVERVIALGPAPRPTAPRGASVRG